MSKTTKKPTESEGLSIWSKWLDDRSNLEIVEWLRAYTDSIDPHTLTKSKVKKEISSRMSQRFRAAADDIERLRQLFGDSERLSGRLQETVDQLRERLGGMRIELDEAIRERDEALVDLEVLIDELRERRTDAAEANERIQQLLGVSEQLRAERDEARRLASEYACITEMGVRAFARNKGWDCFKEETP